MRMNSTIHPESSYIPDVPTKAPASQLSIPSRLRKIWQLITDCLFSQAELEIREIYDRSGNLWWYVYDPVTGRFAWLDSEDEVRIWIEKNY